MGKLIKYNLKCYYKEILILLSLVVLSNLTLFYKVNKWPREIIFVLSIVILSFACLVVLIWNINMFSKDLYSDTSYLIFTLPVKGRSILGAKLLTSIIQLILVNIVAGIYIYIHLKNSHLLYFDIASYLTFKNIFIASVIGIFSHISLLLTIYVSIVLSRVAIRKKKLGKLGSFGIFVFIMVIITKLSIWLEKIFPQTIELTIKPSTFISHTTNSARVTLNFINVNIASTIFDIVFMVILFIVISYLLQEKVEI
ncbi:ABC transporter permease [Clostridium tepidum]|uniref:ABC transporter permease n=1 Tax=Clostridium tepidum TaxID=1962263 RepID=A0A1S9IHY7_9CLOT|nr:ABC transporter permease [Clostridium tepidum]MCR1934584.1 ABC transporter permease [Clostridium tepidum]MDU6877618.1 ABC transporter permease [Clostridium botulinum]OOO62537.1 ABC transporter permease [Clostridium tepidum]OOO69815.1 ABC transporter permease [Clostridium tepidum]